MPVLCHTGQGLLTCLLYNRCTKSYLAATYASLHIYMLSWSNRQAIFKLH